MPPTLTLIRCLFCRRVLCWLDLDQVDVASLRLTCKACQHVRVWYAPKPHEKQKIPLS